MDTRVAVVAIIVREEDSVAELNALLHQYGGYVIGRDGRTLPAAGRECDQRGGGCAGRCETSALSGKLGRLRGVTAKTVYAPEEALQ